MENRDALIKAGAIAAVLYEVSNTLTKAAGTQVRFSFYIYIYIKIILFMHDFNYLLSILPSREMLIMMLIEDPNSMILTFFPLIKEVFIKQSCNSLRSVFILQTLIDIHYLVYYYNHLMKIMKCYRLKLQLQLFVMLKGYHLLKSSPIKSLILICSIGSKIHSDFRYSIIILHHLFLQSVDF